jgi:DNA adenine methylase
MNMLNEAVISDLNTDLIDLYIMIKEQPEKVIENLQSIEYKNNAIDYYKARQEYNEIKERRSPRKAALFIYLNRHGFNGLYRVNSKGEFNVPFGRYSNPKLPSREEILVFSEMLKHVRILNEDFEKAVAEAREGDFIYFDPPYMPLSRTAYFTDYSSYGFTENDQRRLAKVFRALSERGCMVMESNSAMPLIYELYSDFIITKVKARRNINSIASRRGPIEELIITNYKVD